MYMYIYITCKYFIIVLYCLSIQHYYKVFTCNVMYIHVYVQCKYTLILLIHVQCKSYYGVNLLLDETIAHNLPVSQSPV